MKIFLLILGIVVVALNGLLWYFKKRSRAAGNETSSASKADSGDFLNSPKADELKQAAAAELGIPIEKLNQLSADEIAHLAVEKGLMN
jgi:hypothetical protein